MTLCAFTILRFAGFFPRPRPARRAKPERRPRPAGFMHGVRRFHREAGGVSERAAARNTNERRERR